MIEPLLSLLLFGAVPLHGLAPADAAGRPAVTIAVPVPSPLSPEPTTISLARRLSASGAVILDLDSAQLLYSSGPKEVHAMASLTKLMTALLIVENHRLDEWVTIPPEVNTATGSMLRLLPGQQLKVGDLVSGLLVPSANDAAISLAVYHSGSVGAFVEAMNARAKELGLRDTRFANPTGLDDDDHRSTARDLGWLTMYVLRQPEIFKRMELTESRITTRSGSIYTLIHTHQLLRRDGSPIIAGKTGTTDLAKECLISIVEEGGRRTLVVLLHSDDRYGDMQTILDALPKTR